MERAGAKRCTGCGEHKPRGEFYADERLSDGLTCRCKACLRAVAAQRMRERRAADPAYCQPRRSGEGA
jgi:hypothetical protein